MKRFVIVLLHVLILASVSAWAQEDFPKTQVFGGFSALSLGDSTERINNYGVQGSLALNFRRFVGIAGDFGAQFKEGGKIFQYMAGPRIRYSHGTATLFAHALLGGLTFSYGGSESAFALGFGGGVDVDVNDRVAVRIIQFDWIPATKNSVWETGTIRFGFGIVINR